MAKAKKTEEKTAATYEAMFLLGSAHATDVDAATKVVRGIIERHDGKVIVLKKWDERKLAYEIRGEKRGLYVIAFFTAPSVSIAAIVRDVELSDQILRAFPCAGREDGGVFARIGLPFMPDRARIQNVRQQPPQRIQSKRPAPAVLT